MKVKCLKRGVKFFVWPVLRCSFLLFFFSFSGGSLAQNSRLQLKVGDVAEINTPISVASLTIVSAKDSVVLYRKLTDRFGSAYFDLPLGKYRVAVSHIGFYSVDTIVLMESEKAHEVAIWMKKRPVTGEDINVYAVKKQLEPVAGGYLFNPDKKITSLSPSSKDIMLRLPGVTQDSRGALKLLGQDVVVWLDGRPLLLKGEELNNFLRTLKSEDIKSIRVYTTPPAIYDASGTNILEIITVRNFTNGLHTRLDAGVSTYGKFMVGCNLSYASKRYTGQIKFQFDRYNIRFYYEKNEQTNFLLPDTMYRYSERSDNNNIRTNTISVSTTHDFALKSKNVIGITIRYNGYEKLPYLTSADLKIKNRADLVVRERQFDRIDDNDNKMVFTGINYRDVIGKKNATLTVDLSYFFRENTRFFDQKTLVYNELDLLTGFSDVRKNNSVTKIGVKMGGVNFVQPVSAKTRVTLGAKVTAIDNNSNFSEDFSPNTAIITFIKDTINTYRLTYSETITAAFANVNSAYKKLQFQAGVRWENTSTKVGTDRNGKLTSSDNTYSQLFPSLSVNYKASKTVSVGAGISRNIIRIQYPQLNPLNLRTSATISTMGNPYLVPILQNAFSFSLNKSIGSKHTIAWAIRYSVSKNSFTSLLVADTIPGQFLQKYFTYKGNKSLYTNVSYNTQLTDWFTASAGVRFFNTWIQLNGLAGLPDPKATPTFGADVRFIFSVLKNAAFEISGQYQSNQVTPMGKGGKYYYSDFAFSKSFLSESLTVSLNISDIFNTNKLTYFNTGNNFQNTRIEKNETRIGSVNISYKLGNQRKNKIKSYQNQEDRRFSGG